MSEIYMSIEEAAELLTSVFSIMITRADIVRRAKSTKTPLAIYTNEKQKMHIRDIEEISAIPSQNSFCDALILRQDLQDYVEKLQENGIAEQRIKSEEEVKARHKLGRYTLDEAIQLISHNAPIDSNYIKEKLTESAGSGELKIYRPYGLQPYEPKPNNDIVYIPGLSIPIKNHIPIWYVEVFWDDLNNWLEKREPRIRFKFPYPNNLTAEQPMDAPISNSADDLVPKVQIFKQRRNVLDPAIDEAIKRAGSTDYAGVYLHLKEMAKDEFPPFTGVFNNDALRYTNDNDNLAEISKGALRQRLKRRKKLGLNK